MLLGALWLLGVAVIVGVGVVRAHRHTDTTTLLEGERSARVLYERVYLRLRDSGLPLLAAKDNGKSTLELNHDLLVWLYESTYKGQLEQMAMDAIGLRTMPRTVETVQALEQKEDQSFKVWADLTTGAGAAWLFLGLAGCLAFREERKRLAARLREPMSAS
jgi:hypothetical protein